jgi:UDP-glucose 4-epimerase
MKVFVTGGAGFIGSHLCEALVSRGDSVLALDDLSTGSRSNVSGLRGNADFDLIEGDVLDRRLVGDLVDASDAVIHLASPVGVKLIVDQPLRSLHTMIHGTETVLDAARRGKKKVLVASTSEIYGKNTGRLHEDADRLLGPTSIPRWTYATAKAIDEFLAFGYLEDHDVPTVVLRFFNTVGPRQTGAYGMVLPRFVARALLAEDLIVYGDGTQRRCFCHVADAVRAIPELLDNADAVGRAFNIASHEEVTILGLAHRVLQITGSNSAIRHVPAQATYGNRFEEIMRRQADIHRITELTGWTPSRSLDSTIRDIVAAAEQSGPRSLLPDAA